MAVISKGQTFATGDQVTALKLNNLADNATFASGAVDNVSTQLSGGAIIVKDGGVTTAKIADSGVTTAKIANSNVTKSKIENVADMKVLGNTSGTAAAPQEVAILDEDTMSSDSATSLATQQSIKAYVDAITIGVNQTWQDMSSSRAASTSYQNTTGKSIMAATMFTGSYSFQISTDNSSWVTVDESLTGTDESHCQVIIPNNHYYKITGGSIRFWSELR